jgi:hypothetical protein
MVWNSWFDYPGNHVSVCTIGRVMKPKKSLGILALYFFVDLIYIKTEKIFFFRFQKNFIVTGYIDR